MLILESRAYKKKVKKLIKGNPLLRNRIDKTKDLLSVDPFYPSLRTHNVATLKNVLKFSSHVTGDLRIIWRFEKDNNTIIFLITIGGHSGKDKVYN